MSGVVCRRQSGAVVLSSVVFFAVCRLLSSIAVMSLSHMSAPSEGAQMSLSL